MATHSADHVTIVDERHRDGNWYVYVGCMVCGLSFRAPHDNDSQSLEHAGRKVGNWLAETCDGPPLDPEIARKAFFAKRQKMREEWDAKRDTLISNLDGLLQRGALGEDP